MKPNSIWLDLNIGHLSTNEIGEVLESPLVKNRSHITALELGNIEKYKDQLHELLDEQINKAVGEYGRLKDRKDINYV